MSNSILWGSMGPDSHAFDPLEQAVGKLQSMPHYGLAWAYGRKTDGTPNFAPFPNVPGANPYNFLIPAFARGSVPLVDWVSWDLNNQADPAFDMARVVAGDFDAFLHQWFKDCAASGKEVILRINSEFNGNWWRFGNQPDLFKQFWAHVRAIRNAEGAKNAAFCWCCNVLAPAGTQWSTSREKLKNYRVPDDQLEWSSFDGYNAQASPWMTFEQVLTGYPGWLDNTYAEILSLYPSKPMLIGEFNCVSDARKPYWLLDALARIPVQFPQIRAINLFNWAADGKTWPLAGDDITAWKYGIAHPAYLPPMPNLSGQVAPQIQVNLEVPPPAGDQYGSDWPSIGRNAEQAADSLAAQLAVANASVKNLSTQLSQIKGNLKGLLQVAQS
jgi:hypothetical protein